MQQTKKFIALESGRLQTIENDKFVNKGNCTIGVDDKGRRKIIVNVGDFTYSGFINPILDEEQKRKLNEYKTNLLKNKGR